MKKSNLIRRMALGSFASVALLASAQGVTEFPNTQKWTPSPEEMAVAPMKAPLNTEKPKGAYMFGSMLDDYNLLRNFASIYVNEPSNINKLKLICEPDPDNWMYEALFGLLAGSYGGDGYYYGYRLRMYSFVDYLHDFVKVNPYTGEFESLRSWTDQENSLRQVQPVYDMAYNPADGEVYALANDPESTNIAMSMIGTIDLRTGDFKKLCSLNRYYFGIAFDYDGNLYGVTWEYRAEGNGQYSISGTRLDQFDDEFEYIKGTRLLVDESPFIPYYQHGLEFDYTTGDLYWAACDYANHKQSLVRINPDNGKTENLGVIGRNEQMVGLHIPFITADARTAPARVSNLSYAFDPQGANKTTLTWTNPTTQWNRKDLADLVEVNIYRDDMKSAPVGTVAAAGQKGKEMSWTDETAERGLHKYYVVPSSVKGQAGIMDSISAFVGRDLPGAPRNVAATTPEGKTVNLKWDAPNRGDSDGWFDTDVTYTVTRTADGKVIAQDIKECSATDNDIPEATTYTYAVVAKNNEGVSEPGLSNGVLAGQSLKVPFYTDFPDETDAGRFAVIDANEDGIKFYYSYNTNKAGTKCYNMILSDYTNDDYLVTPPFKVQDGHSYRVSYTISVGRYGEYDQAWTQDFRVVGGQNPTLDGMEDVYVDCPKFVFNNQHDRQTLSAEFTADHDGDHYAALNVYTTSEIKDTWLYVEDCLIEEVFDNDLEAALLDVPGIISCQEDALCPNVFKVTVNNPGLKEQKDYKVEVGFKSLTGDFIPFIDSSDVEVPALAHNEKQTIVLKGFPKKMDDGNYQVMARVVLEGDEYPANDLSEPLDVRVDDKPALNYTVTQNKEASVTYPPLNFYTPYSAYQTIYSPEMMAIEIEGDDAAYLKRLAWQYNADKDINGTDIKVYLGQTNVKLLESGSKEWVVNNQEKVYEGKVDIKKGDGFIDIVLDEPFEFDPDMSLVVTVLKYNNSVSGEWPVRFRVFDYEQKSLKTWHSMGYSGSTEFDLNSYNAFNTFCYAQAPVLFMAVPGAESGVCVIGAEENSQVVLEDGVLSFGALDVREVSVWSVDGKLVKKGAVAGGSIALDVLPGIYVVNATLADGENVTLKVRANR